MKTTSIFFFLFLMTTICFAQIRVSTTGTVSVGSLSPLSYARLLVESQSNIGLLVQKTTSVAWERASISVSNNTDTKHWSVAYANTGVDKFFVTTNGNVYYTYLTSLSDRKMKENIKNINTPLNIIKGLNGVSYNFIPSDEEKANNSKMPTCYGLIAQDVEKVIPEIVFTDENGTKSLGYINLIAILIEAVKEQDKKIESLQSIVSGYNLTPNTVNTSKSYINQNTPNPFNTDTKIAYYIDGVDEVGSIYFFDMQGVLKKSIDNLKQGKNEIIINANEFTPGMYLYSLVIDGKEIDTKRMILTK